MAEIKSWQSPAGNKVLTRRRGANGCPRLPAWSLYISRTNPRTWELCSSASMNASMVPQSARVCLATPSSSMKGVAEAVLAETGPSPPSSIFKLMRGLTPNHVLDLDLDALWCLWVECFCLIAAQTAINNHRVLGSPFCPPTHGFSWVSSSSHETNIRDGVSSRWVPVTSHRASCKTWRWKSNMVISIAKLSTLVSIY